MVQIYNIFNKITIFNDFLAFFTLLFLNFPLLYPDTGGKINADPCGSGSTARGYVCLPWPQWECERERRGPADALPPFQRRTDRQIHVLLKRKKIINITIKWIFMATVCSLGKWLYLILYFKHLKTSVCIAWGFKFNPTLSTLTVSTEGRQSSVQYRKHYSVEKGTPPPSEESLKERWNKCPSWSDYSEKEKLNKCPS